ncbi:MAG: hypothetical protein Ct9H300mP1_03230 [Planctomycetaceae bacterium]|nr:MAG: hypothetical protein Ct9H300mP1_03230 [Planctomycetaceae bacterium]
MGKPRRNLPTITSAWLPGKYVVAMAATRIGFSATTGSVEDRLSGLSLEDGAGMSSGMGALVESVGTVADVGDGGRLLPRTNATTTRQVVAATIDSDPVRGDATMETPCGERDRFDYCPS